ncbi:MAG: hypothetical protein KGH55_02735 [Nanoarchaeota archaeon]|nr:hypothetical protein [Nanoarchaeota archaeon]
MSFEDFAFPSGEDLIGMLPVLFQAGNYREAKRVIDYVTLFTGDNHLIEEAQRWAELLTVDGTKIDLLYPSYFNPSSQLSEQE